MKNNAPGIRHKEKYAALFFLGAGGYGMIELLWRGYTHWSMLLAGGIFLCLYGTLLEEAAGLSFFKKCLLGSVLITALELIFGSVFNVALSFAVWDYSDVPFNLFGQICLPFSLLWFFLCVPLVKILEKLLIKAS